MKNSGLIIKNTVSKRSRITSVYYALRWFVSFSMTVGAAFSIIYGVGGNSFEFLLLPDGARAAAMAGAYTSVTDDSSSVFYNPAAVGFLSETDVSLSHSEWLEGINFENVSFAEPVTNRLVLSGGAEYLAISKIVAKETQTSPETEFNSYDFSPAVGISYLVNKNVSFGLSPKYIEEKIDTQRADAFAVDAGAIYRQRINSHRSFSAGLATRNIALKRPQFIDQKEELPSEIAFGVSYQPLGESLLLSSDLVFLKGSKPSANFGCEVMLNDVLTLRGGYKLDPSFEAASKFSLGLGIAFGSLTLNYAYLPFESLTDSHIFSVNLKFK